MNTTRSIYRFVTDHGFTAWTSGGAVVIVIPFVSRDGNTGAQQVRVTTWEEARTALGY